MKKLCAALTALSLTVMSVTAQAGIHTDASGNVGYDTLQECQAALANGTAKFYKSHTFKPPLLRKGETSVKQGRLGDLHEAFRAGTCDVGTGHRLNRDGVSKALQGKYIPYSPDMTINAYANSKGEIVRVTMQQCDNWFSGNFPKASFVQTGSAPTSSAVTTKPATMTATTVAPAGVTSVPTLAQTGATTAGASTTGVASTTATASGVGTAGATAGTVAGKAGVMAGAAKAGAAAGTAAGATAGVGAVAAAQGITSMLLPLGVLGAIGVGTAVLMNNDTSEGAGTTGTTGTR